MMVHYYVTQFVFSSTYFGPVPIGVAIIYVLFYTIVSLFIIGLLIIGIRYILNRYLCPSSEAVQLRAAINIIAIMVSIIGICLFAVFLNIFYSFIA